MEKLKIGIIGAAGYTAGELIRLLIHHPSVEISLLQSSSNAGKPVSDVHSDLFYADELVFAEQVMLENLDLLFLCKGHGESAKIIEKYPAILEKKIVDLSQDYRIAGDHDFIYGLPELNASAIAASAHVANPGCFATSIQLGLLPLISSDKTGKEIHISGITGSTGAGQGFSRTSHFSWRTHNASVYKSMEHQHLLEIGQSFQQLGSDDIQINFIPYRGAFSRGIITTSYQDTDLKDQELKEMYREYYREALFTYVVDHTPDLKQIVNTNYALVFPEVKNGKAVVVSVIDNLLKGASGQAVQNMNLMAGFEEKMGLTLKSIAY